MEEQTKRLTDTRGACINWNGDICKSGDFTSRMNFKNSKWNPSNELLETIKNSSTQAHESIDDIDDPAIYEWYQIGSDKYGRSMYCPKTSTKRSQTMGEFYGNSTVD